MKVYTFSEARQHLSTLLDEATQEGAVCIKHRDGRVFLLTPEAPRRSPLDREGFPLHLSADDIVSFVREGRARESPDSRS